MRRSSLSRVHELTMLDGLRPGDLYQTKRDAEFRIVIGISDAGNDYRCITFVTSDGVVDSDVYPLNDIILLAARAH